MSKRITFPTRTECYAYTGLSLLGHLGHWGIRNAHPAYTRRFPADAPDLWEQTANPGDRAYLCRVTLTPILDRKGRPITRVHK